MAANLFFVLYECSRPEEARGAAQKWNVVLTLHNERPIALPACGQEIFCPLETIAAELAHDPRTRDPCRFDQVCGVGATARTAAAGACGSDLTSASEARCEEEVPPAGARFGFAAAVGRRAPAISDTALALALAAALVGITVVALLAWMVRHYVSLAGSLPAARSRLLVCVARLCADLIVSQAVSLSDACADQVARRDSAARVGPQTRRTKTRTLRPVAWAALFAACLKKKKRLTSL